MKHFYQQQIIKRYCFLIDKIDRNFVINELNVATRRLNNLEDIDLGLRFDVLKSLQHHGDYQQCTKLLNSFKNNIF